MVRHVRVVVVVVVGGLHALLKTGARDTRLMYVTPYHLYGRTDQSKAKQIKSNQINSNPKAPAHNYIVMIIITII